MNRVIRRIINLLVVLLAIGVVCYGALIGYVVYREKHIPEPSAYDVIVVLGAQVKATGEPSVQLRWRLDKALEMYFTYPCPVIVCGAQGSDEPRPEADVMRDLLIADGIPAERIFSDPVSRNTYQNIGNAMEIMERLGVTTPLIITSDYHLSRAMDIAKAEGVEAQGAASPTKRELQFWLKNHGREALAFVKFWLIYHVGLNL